MDNDTENNTQTITCTIHPDVQATGECFSCQKPLCEECCEWINGKVFCPECQFEAHQKADLIKSHHTGITVLPVYHTGLMSIAFVLTLVGTFFFRRNMSIINGLLFSTGLFLFLVSFVLSSINRSYEYAVKWFFWIINIFFILFALLIAW